MKRKACKRCSTLFEGNKCPNCESTDSTDSWKGIIHVLNPEESEISKKIKINKKGVYAIKTK